MSDERTETLVRAAIAGDKGAFQALMDAYERKVFAIAYSHVHNFSQSEDVVQEVFLRAYVDLGKLKDFSRFAGWLSGIALHVSVDWLRKRKAMRVSLDDPELGPMPDSAAGAPEEPLLTAEVRDRVERAVEDLPEQTRTCVCLRYFQDLSYSEIAEMLGVPASTVRGALYRGTKVLREELRDVWKEVG